jgi:predicted DNA-binding transcriptional regulator AlpA
MWSSAMRELWTKKKTANVVGFHGEHLMRLAREGKFPKPIKMGEAKNSGVRFVAEEVENWVAGRMAAR